MWTPLLPNEKQPSLAAYGTFRSPFGQLPARQPEKISKRTPLPRPIFCVLTHGQHLGCAVAPRRASETFSFWFPVSFSWKTMFPSKPWDAMGKPKRNSTHGLMFFREAHRNHPWGGIDSEARQRENQRKANVTWLTLG